MKTTAQQHTTSTVVVKACPAYDTELVYHRLKEGLQAIGSLGTFVKAGEKVLLKPNMLTGCPPEQAVNTHPSVVEAAARLVLEAGAKPFIGDSPMFGTATQASQKAGYAEVAARLGIKIIDFTRPRRCECKDGVQFKSFEIDSAVMEADRIINLAKLKSHTQMYLTMCVKNMFGCVVGRDKLKWHYIAGKSYDTFARVLVELYRCTRPVLNILDGVVAMEGYGPLTGPSRKIGALLLGADAVAVDRVACALVGADPAKVPVFKASEELHAGVSCLEDISIIGDSLAVLTVRDFQFPRIEPMDAGALPGFLKGIVRDTMTARPAVDRKKCRLCGMCVQACPAEAMKASGKIKIDYRSCIRCYCCVEACEHRAITIHTPLLARIVR
jgi:uncharacterized protein (DUF362 family)/Pyruvate/2-oxoacid:ferredoxin oxidoreductase delta subunit